MITLDISESYSVEETYFKNVDICDLPSILQKGILPISVCQNFNWDFGKRVNNSQDVVYLFRPNGYENSFVQYGLALVEVTTDGIENEMDTRDVNRGKYTEYVCGAIPPENIIAVYIPKVFKARVPYSNSKIHWVDVDAKIFDYETEEYVDCDNETLELFAKTANTINSDEYNYLVGQFENREAFKLYYWHYDI